jgi:Uma2 family endonuclease
MPDLSVVLGAKVEHIDRNATCNTVGPDLAVEVLSPEEDDEFVEGRLGDYLKLGTSEVWFVDPGVETVAGHAWVERGYTHFAVACGEEMFSSRLLSGLTFPIRSLWMRRR